MTRMDDFGNDYWNFVDFRQRGDFNSITWRIMYFYGMVCEPNWIDAKWIDLMDNVV